MLSWYNARAHCEALGPRCTFGEYETMDKWNTVRTEINSNFPTNIWVAVAWQDDSYVWLNSGIPVEDRMWGIPSPTSNLGCVYMDGNALLRIAINCGSRNVFLCEYS